jgi:hypothetical protein
MAMQALPDSFLFPFPILSRYIDITLSALSSLGAAFAQVIPLGRLYLLHSYLGDQTTQATSKFVADFKDVQVHAERVRAI